MKEKYIKNILNILFIISIIIMLNIVYRYFVEKNVYKKIDFLAFKITDMKDYSISKNCVENYLFSAKFDYNTIGHFLHNQNKEKNEQYSKKIAESETNIQIKDVKKSISNVYIVYYTKNENIDNVNRIVFKISGNKYQVLYDSMYEEV